VHTGGRAGDYRIVTIAFSVEGKPIQQGSMRAFNNRIVHNKTKELMGWRSKVAQAAHTAGCLPIDGAITISMRFRYLRPKSVTRVQPTVPPDLDKQIRSILDALTGIAYKDDSQVVSITATKEYQGSQGVDIVITGGFDHL
jgi:Holliday junction resolvase RusA-like endonuclease